MMFGSHNTHVQDYTHAKRQRSSSPPHSLSSLSSSSPSFDTHLFSPESSQSSKVCPLCDEIIYGSTTSDSFTVQDALEEHVDLCRMRRLRSTGSRWFCSPGAGEEDQDEDDRMFSSAVFNFSGMGDAAEFGGFGASIEADRLERIVPRSFNARRKQLLGRIALRRRHPNDVKR